MDRHPLRKKKRKLKRENPDFLGGTTSVLYYMESYGYVRLLLTKTFAKTLTNSEKKWKEILMDARDLFLKLSWNETL
jgi:hypothetical protein